MEESADRGDDGAETTDGHDGRRRLVAGIGDRRTVLLAALGLVACGLARLVAAVRAIAGTWLPEPPWLPESASLRLSMASLSWS